MISSAKPGKSSNSHEPTALWSFQISIKRSGVQSRQTDCSATTGWCFQVWQRLPSIGTPLSAIFMGHHIFQIPWRYLIRPLDSTQRGNTTIGKSGKRSKRSSSISPSSDTVVDSPHLLNSQPPPPWGPGATRSGPCRSDSPQGRKGGTRHGDVAASMEV